MIGLGPGKYDLECTAAQLATQAESIVLMVVEGTKGSGLSIQTRDAAFLVALPQLLRTLARDMEARSCSSN